MDKGKQYHNSLTEGRCKPCESAHIVRANGGFMFLGCYHKPYKGKWVAEIKDCPKEEEVQNG